ncbi:MAG: hypothetical protein A4S09_07080 [Proteobacteria bacterium SG_bin7]|nr:MAG: hypothetical protein A4S09_07080 [Proteobacteria bacterium SG_bin7]
MKRFLKYIVIFIVVFILSFGIASVTVLPDYLKNFVEQKFASSTSGTLSIGNVKVTNFYPYTLKFQNIVVETKAFSGSIENFTVGVGFGPRLTVFIHKANLRVKEKNMDVTAVEQKEPARVVNIPSVPLAFDLDIRESKLSLRNSATPIDLQNINFKAGFESLVSPIRIRGETQVMVGNEVIVPIEVNSELQFQNGAIVIRNTDVSVLSLKSYTTGYFHPQTLAMDINTKLRADELDKIPLFKNVPIKSWSGGVNVEARVYRKDANDRSFVTGKFDFTNLKIQSEFKNKDMEVNGMAMLASSGEFNYTDTLNVQNLKWNADFSRLAIKYKNFLDKPQGIQLLSRGELGINTGVNIKEGSFRFDTFLLNANGVYDPKGASDFKLDLKPTVLKGLERYFPVIREYPLEGNVEARGRIVGNLSKPNDLSIQFDPIIARNVRGKISYKSEKVSLNGIVSADLNGRLQTQGPHVQSGNMRAFVDVSAMEIQVPDVITKRAGQTLRLDIDAGKIKEDFLIKKGTLQTFFGSLEVRGKPPLKFSDNMTLKISSQGINLKFTPVISKVLKAGDMKFDLAVNGQYNTEDFWTSPLAVVGDIVVDLPEYRSVVEAVANEKDEAKPPTDVKALLPESKLVNGLNLNYKARIGYFSVDKLIAKNVSVSGKVLNRVLTVSAGSIGEIFGGSVNLKNISIPLTVSNPLIKLESDFLGLDVAQALGFVNAQWKDLAKGRVSGDVVGKTQLPGSPQFLDELAGEGRFSLKEGQLSTLNFETMVKEKLSKIPGAKEMNLSRGPLQANANGEYKLEKKFLRLLKFHGATPRNEEMNLKGLIGMDMSIDLQGNVSLVDWPGGGDLYEANKDAKGRINIPINVVGNALNPELSFAGDTIKQMVAKLAEYELKKKRKGIEENLKKDLESKLKNIFK